MAGLRTRLVSPHTPRLKPGVSGRTAQVETRGLVHDVPVQGLGGRSFQLSQFKRNSVFPDGYVGLGAGHTSDANGRMRCAPTVFIRARICVDRGGSRSAGVASVGQVRIRGASWFHRTLAPAVLSTRNHRGNSCALPRHAPIPRMPLLANMPHLYIPERAAIDGGAHYNGRHKACTEPRHYGRGTLGLLGWGRGAVVGDTEE